MRTIHGDHIYFLLVPFDAPAEAVLQDPRNRNLLRTNDDGIVGLAVPYPKDKSKVMAVLGRGSEVDIFINSEYISRAHATFVLDMESGAVMLHATNPRTFILVQNDGIERYDFGPSLPRKILVSTKVNRKIGFGSSESNVIKFELVWEKNRMDRQTRKSFYNLVPAQPTHDRRTLDTGDATAFASPYETRIYTPQCSREIRYSKYDEIGEGSVGRVFKAIDVDTGCSMAIKIQERPDFETCRESWVCMKREVESLSELKHVSASCSRFK